MNKMKLEIQKEMDAMVKRGADVNERKKAMRQLQKAWHPDKNPDKEEVAKQVFQFIEESKDWFMDS